jgi:hypothetical protein
LNQQTILSLKQAKTPILTENLQLLHARPAKFSMVHLKMDGGLPVQWLGDGLMKMAEHF